MASIDHPIVGTDVSRLHARGAATILDPSDGFVTIINTYTVEPDRAEALMDLLVTATTTTLRHLPGFVSANFHIGMDRTQVVNYAQWRSREAIAAARENPEVAALIGEAGRIATSFAPVMYELRASVCGLDE